MLLVCLVIIAILAAFCLVRPTFLLPLAAVAGFIQDPMRKLIAGEPVFMVIMVGVVFGAGFLGYFFRHGMRSVTEIQIWMPQFKLPVLLFFLLVTYQAFYSLFNYQSIIVAAIGFMVYTAPLFAIAISYFAINRQSELTKFAVLYCVFALVLAGTVVLSFTGVQSQLLKEVGTGLIIYDQGTILKAHAGFMRTSEIAGWHMGTGACFLVILAFASRSRTQIIVAALAVTLLLLAIGMTGRRKMIMQFFIFICLYSAMFMYYRRTISLQVVFLAILAVGVIWFASMLAFPGFSDTNLELYYARGVSVFDEADERLTKLGIESVLWAINRVGWFGAGVGIASQGSQYFSAGIAGGAAEGGLGKIVAELGVPGLLLAAWLMFMTIRFCSKTLHFVSMSDSVTSRLAIGVCAFVLANVPTYIVASQVYGDLFVLITLGFMVGFVFAVPKLLFLEQERQQKASHHPFI